MQIEIGSVLEGKVTGIMKFGAFVDLPDGKSGMVHISEISNTYVENVSDFLTVGQEVKVKVISINESGKIGLSIKKLEDSGERPSGDRPERKGGDRRPQGGRGGDKRSFNRREDRPPRGDRSSQPSMKSANAPGDFVWQKTANPSSFEDMMTKFKQQSDEKMSTLKKNGDVVPRRPRRK